MTLLVVFAFLAGLATIAAPCIWPLLPVVLSLSVKSSSRFRSLGITLGIILSFSFFTLFLSYLVQIFHIDASLFRLFAVVVIGFLGLSMVVPSLGVILEKPITKLGSLFKFKAHSGLGGGFVTGLTLGVVWSPCAGPILASIAALSALRQLTSYTVLLTLAYALGAGIPLFILSLGSQKILTKTKFLSSYTPIIQKIFGVIMILTAVAIYTNYDVLLSATLANALPSFTSASNGFETNSVVSKALSHLNTQSSPSSLDNLGSAPDFVGITHWLNTDKPIHISDLKGKVVLVDFWTYTCINCIRTLPFVTSWYDKYKDQGFVVIGVHTPEFEFEKDTSNVLSAIQRYHIHYPVAQDNDYATWNNYSNEYWPAEYLIDAQGRVRETHFGEGNYQETEKNIQSLLREAGRKVSNNTVNITDQTPTSQQSPETYLGSAKAQFFYPSGGLPSGTGQFTLNPSLPLNSFDLGGNWDIESDQITSNQDGVLEYHFIADKVFLVLRPPDSSVGKIRVLLDGKVVDEIRAGTDVVGGIVTVDSDRLYNLIDLKGNEGAHTLRLEFQSPGIKAYAFTFG